MVVWSVARWVRVARSVSATCQEAAACQEVATCQEPATHHKVVTHRRNGAYLKAVQGWWPMALTREGVSRWTEAATHQVEGQEQAGVQDLQMGQGSVKVWDLEEVSQTMTPLSVEDPVAVAEVRKKGRDEGSGQNQAHGEDQDLPTKLPSHACWHA